MSNTVSTRFRPEQRPAGQSKLSKTLSCIKTGSNAVINHLVKHTGVGIICAVAYFDPGNWGVDLQAGSQYGYKLLFVVLLSGLFAVFLQILATRLGCVTGMDLAAHCRLLLHSRQRHTMLYRWLLLYPLYILSEAAIIATDLAELLGSGIALCLLFPKLPLWAGVLITASDVFVLLALKDPLGGKPVRTFEIIIGALVFSVLICMAIIIAQVGVRWGPAFDGYIPSKEIFSSGGLYVSIGIIGATVMPHSIFLGSSLSSQDRLSMQEEDLASVDSALSDDSSIIRRVKQGFCEAFRSETVQKKENEPKTHAEHENRPYAFVRAHIYHGMIDIAVSLLGIAVVINSLILILASAVFYYGEGQGSGGPASLFDAYDLLNTIVGKGPATLFALALLAAGQSSSIIATMAGQIVSEGFLRWRVSPIMRRVITRSLGLVPSMAVAIASGRDGVDTLLVASQVALSIVLPFIVFPLLYLTNSSDVMTVRRSRSGSDTDSTTSFDTDESKKQDETRIEEVVHVDVESSLDRVDFSNGKIAATIGWLLWLIIVAANLYAIVTLGMGQE